MSDCSVSEGKEVGRTSNDGVNAFLARFSLRNSTLAKRKERLSNLKLSNGPKASRTSQYDEKNLNPNRIEITKKHDEKANLHLSLHNKQTLDKKWTSPKYQIQASINVQTPRIKQRPKFNSMTSILISTNNAPVDCQQQQQHHQKAEVQLIHNISSKQFSSSQSTTIQSTDNEDHTNKTETLPSLKRIKYNLNQLGNDSQESELKSSVKCELTTLSEDEHRDSILHDQHKVEPLSPSDHPKDRNGEKRHKLVYLVKRNPSSVDLFNKHMPWFGIDVGGTLVKVVFFDPKDATNEELVTLKRIRRYLKSSKPYGTSGKRDSHLEMPNCIINKRVGTLHFIRFATSRMPQFLAMAKAKRFADTIHTVCATGGGAYKFENDIKQNLGITLHKTDELDSIIYGIHYIDKYNSDRECYFLEDPLNDEKCVKIPYDFSRPYPYLVVNIGSGVSILAVYSSTSYSRISGSSIGGGTFLGLCCLLTQCKTFDEAIRLAKAGSSTKLDKLVKDIYGGDYPKFNLSGDTVASSFGHMNIIEKPNDIKREDLARGLLEMVTINIGLVARICAEKEDIDRVVFIGNFLRVNQLSMKLLSYAVNYWSKGSMKALFLEHEGYFGAVGCFVESTQGCHH